MLRVSRKRFLLFLKMYAFYFARKITVVGHLGAERYNRGCLQGGPAVAKLGPLLFLPSGSGGFLMRRIQPGAQPSSEALKLIAYPASRRVQRVQMWLCTVWTDGSPSPSIPLIQRRQVLVSFIFSAVNGCESN